MWTPCTEAPLHTPAWLWIIRPHVILHKGNTQTGRIISAAEENTNQRPNRITPLPLATAASAIISPLSTSVRVRLVKTDTHTKSFGIAVTRQECSTLLFATLFFMTGDPSRLSANATTLQKSLTNKRVLSNYLSSSFFKVFSYF